MTGVFSSSDEASVQVFDMLVNRLSDLEEHVSQIYHFLREPHMNKFQMLDTRLFKWIVGNCQVSVRYDAPVQVCLHTPGKHDMMLLRFPCCALTKGNLPRCFTVRGDDCFLWLEGDGERYVDWYMNLATDLLTKVVDTDKLPDSVCMEAWPLLPAAKSGVYAVVSGLSPHWVRSTVDFHMQELTCHQRWTYLFQHPACRNQSQSGLITAAQEIDHDDRKYYHDPWYATRVV